MERLPVTITPSGGNFQSLLLLSLVPKKLLGGRFVIRRFIYLGSLLKTGSSDIQIFGFGYPNSTNIWIQMTVLIHTRIERLELAIPIDYIKFHDYNIRVWRVRTRDGFEMLLYETYRLVRDASLKSPAIPSPNTHHERPWLGNKKIECQKYEMGI